MAAADPDVFISYTSQDKAVADDVYRALSQSGFRCWMAPQDITPGEKYPRAIVRAIGAVQVFVLIYSAAANRSSHVQGEVNQAFNRNLPILPIRIEDVKPTEDLEYFLGNFHWLDAFNRPWAEQLGELSARVRKLVDQSPRHEAAEPVPVPTPAAARSEAVTFDTVVRKPERLNGMKVGSYVLLSPIGAGGSGLVFKARHATLGQTVCVKLFYPVQAEMARVTAAMQRGLRGLAALSHPNIIRILDQGTATVAGSAVVYLVMDLIAGADLLRWTTSLPDYAAGDPQTFPRRLGVARQIALAMQAAHESRFLDDVGFEQTGVLHGDLKPSNILVRAGDSPVLLDFMLADLQRLVDSRFREQREAESKQRLDAALRESIAETQTLTGIFGTPGFMSWEQEQQGIVTTRSDIYGLGVTFCLLFFPAVAEGIDEVGFNHRDLGPGRDLKSVLDPNSGDGRNASRRIFGGEETLSLRNLLGRMISDNESQRPASMRAIGEELERIQNALKATADQRL